MKEDLYDDLYLEEKEEKTDFKAICSFFFIDSGFNFKFNIEKQTGRFQQ